MTKKLLRPLASDICTLPKSRQGYKLYLSTQRDGEQYKAPNIEHVKDNRIFTASAFGKIK